MYFVKFTKMDSLCNSPGQILEIVRGKFYVIFNQTSDDGQIKERRIEKIIARIIILQILLTFAVLNFMIILICLYLNNSKTQKFDI